MAVEYRGSEYLYLVHVPESDEEYRLFNQTDGTTDTEVDEIELDTKDKTGADYGATSQSISIEGIITEGDDAYDYIRKAQRRKEFVKILEINTRTKETEEGAYMITSISRSYSNGEYATYSIDATLNGEVKEGTLEDVPEGAPEEDITIGGGEDEEGKDNEGEGGDDGGGEEPEVEPEEPEVDPDDGDEGED